MTRGKDTGEDTGEVSADGEIDTDDTSNAASVSTAGANSTGKTEDYKEFDLVATMKAAGIGVLCLDECHHLRSEWWKALEDFKNQLGNVRIIALTATPPYDSTPAMWNRYMNMCGEIDEEITIPELVKKEVFVRIRTMFISTIRPKKKNRKSRVSRREAAQW